MSCCAGSSPACCTSHWFRPKDHVETKKEEREGVKGRVSSRDTGWAWVIVLASFTIQLLIDGTISGFGIIFLEMRNDQAFIQANYTKTMLALPGNIQPGFFLCTGAFVSPLIQRLGFRVMGSIASAMVGSGLALASFQRNLHAFNLFYGVLTGSGFGILMVCAVVSVNFYFERFRGIASGIAMAGAGVGCLTIPLVFRRLCDQMGWRHGLLIYSAVAFLSALLSVLSFRPFVIAVLPNDLTTATPTTGKNAEPSLQMESNDSKVKNTLEQKEMSDLGVSRDKVLSFWRQEKNRFLEESGGRRMSSGSYALTKKGAALESINECDCRNDFGSTVGSRLWKSTLAFKRNKGSSQFSHRCSIGRLLGVGLGDTRNIRSPTCQESYVLHQNSLIADPFSRPDIFYSSSLANFRLLDNSNVSQFITELDQYGQEGTSQLSLQGKVYQSGFMPNGTKVEPHCLPVTSANRLYCSYASSFTSMPPVNDSDAVGEEVQADDREIKPSRYCQLCDQIVQLFDLSLFTNPHFLFIMMIGIANQLAYFIPFVYLVDYAVSKGSDTDQAVILSVILGSLHTIGRILSGVASNVPYIDTVYLSGLGTLAAGLLHLAFPILFPHTFTSFALYAALFGMLIALPVPMIHLLLVRFLGLERLTASYSNLNLMKGFASVIGPMIAVSLVERTGEQGHYFYVAGVCLLLSAMFHMGLCRFPCCQTDDIGDDRARCCFCMNNESLHPSSEEETYVYAIESGNPTS